MRCDSWGKQAKPPAPTIMSRNRKCFKCVVSQSRRVLTSRGVLLRRFARPEENVNSPLEHKLEVHKATLVSPGRQNSLNPLLLAGTAVLTPPTVGETVLATPQLAGIYTGIHVHLPCVSSSRPICATYFWYIRTTLTTS